MNVQDADTVGVRILDAALQLLRSPGPRAVTMQSVTEATGIAKTTLYRRHRIGVRSLRPPWSNWPQPVIDPQASPEQRLRWAIAQSNRRGVNGIGPGGFAALLTNEDPDFSEVFSAIVATYPANQQSPSWIATKVTAILVPVTDSAFCDARAGRVDDPAAVALEGR